MIALRCYDPSGDGKRGIHEWLEGLPPAFAAEVDAALELFSGQGSVATAGQVKQLRGACRGLTEIIIDFDFDNARVHIRILGVPDGQHTFVLLYGFRKVGNADYGAACRSAQNRKDGVGRDGRRARPCLFP